MSARNGNAGGAWRVVLSTVLCAMWLMLPALARGQATTGTVTGTVKDTQGGVLPGASLVLISEGRGTRSAVVTTNGSGDYVFANLAPDTYAVEATMSGFKTFRRGGIAVSPGDRLTVPAIELTLGGASETVNVTAEAPLIQAQSGERSFTIATSAVENLPIASRSFTGLVGLAPGMNGTARLGGGGQNNATFDGIGIIDTGSNSIQLQMNVEAVAEVKVLTSGYQAEYGRSSGVQIAAVTKSGTNQFRGSVYGVRRDSDWNSNSWANIQNGSPKPVSKQTDWGYSIGGPVGRAGGDNKIFFFFTQELRPRTAGGDVTRFRVPTAAERQGNFSQSRNNDGAIYNLIRDASTGLTCSATDARGCFQDGGVIGKIPANRLYPIGMTALNYWPLPNTDAGYAGLNSYNYESIKPKVSSRGHQEAIRGDYQLSPGLRVSGKLLTQGNSLQPNNATVRFGTGATALIPGFNDMVDWVPVMTQWSGSVNYNLSPTAFLEVSYGGFWNQIATLPINDSSNKDKVGLGGFPMIFDNADLIDQRFYTYDILTQLQGRGLAPPYWVDGRIRVPPQFSWGNRIANSPPNVTDFGCCFTINLVNNASITKIAGRHTLKAGFFLDDSYKPQTAGSRAYRGIVDFGNSTNNPLDSTFGFANAALGIFTSYQQANKFIEGNYYYQSDEWYLQDNWKVTNRLTLDYGLRFVHQGQQYDRWGFASQFFENRWSPASAPALFEPRCATTVPCTGQNVRAFNPVTRQLLGAGSSSLVGSMVPGSGDLENGIVRSGVSPNVKENHLWPWLAYAPRLGAAYDLTGDQKFVVRGGFGVFYDRPTGNTMFATVSNPPASTTVTVNNGTLGDLRSGIQASAPPTMTMYDFDAKLPSSLQWNGGVQIALPWASALDVSYVGQHGYNLLGAVDINAPDFGAAYLPQNQNPTLAASSVPGANALPVNFYRPFQGLGAINRTLMVAYNDFHSLQTSWNRRFSRGISLTFNYTLSRNKGTDGNGLRITRKADGLVGLRDDYRQASYHTTGNDRTHVVRANFVWDLPDMAGQGALTRALAAAANDWQLSGVFSGGSGAPYNVGYSYAGGIGAQNLTGTPNYNARVVLTGDPGQGCSDDRTRQFKTSAFSGPQPNSLGLESGLNYMRGCSEALFDLALARNIRLGGGRTFQIRVEAYNVLNTVVFNARNATMNIASLATANVATNLPYDDAGNLIASRIVPSTSGFGVATGSVAARSAQLTLRFSF
jgi:Carboxypeptidase regulatory-like domain